MVASYIKTLVSSANFTNAFRGAYESPKKINIRGSEFKLFVSIFRKLKEIII